MDDVTRRYLSLQRRLIDEGLDADYIELVLHKRAEEVESDVDLDSLTSLIVKETPEKFRTEEAEEGEQQEEGNLYDDLRQQMHQEQESARKERETRVTAFERMRGIR